MPNDIERVDIITPAGKLASVLRKEICDGNYAVGQRLPNERELAERFGVSRGTVRRTLKILSGERLIIRQQGRGTFVADLAYAPARGVKTALIGAMVYEREYFFGAILQGASSQSDSRGYMLTTGSNMTEESELQHVDAFLANGILGVVLAPKQEFSHRAYDRLCEKGVPVVMLDTELLGRDEDFVGVDDFKGAVVATKYLVDLGHKKLGYVGYEHPEQVSGQWYRLSGFLMACRQARIEPRESWRIATSDADYLPVLRNMLRENDRPTAIVAYNDIWAARVIRVAREMGLVIPRDLSVTGFDDSSLSQNHDIGITTIHPEPHELGTAVVNVLIDKIETPCLRSKRSILIVPKLVVRGSATTPPETA